MAWTQEPNPFGQNRTPTLLGVGTDGKTPVPLAADETTGRLLVNATGSSGGTSSTFGATFPTTGTAVGASDGTNMQPLLVDGSGNLKVTGGGGGTQYTDAGTPPAHPIGTMPIWNNAGTWSQTSAAAPLPVTANAGTNLNTSLLATSANQTNASQKTQLVDGSGNVIASTSNALNVDVTNTSIAVTGTVSSDTNDGAGNAITSDSTTTTSTRGLDMNIRSILNTAPTTAGKLDVKGADGDVFVRQPTGSNLHVVADTGSTTTVTQPTASNLNATVSFGALPQPINNAGVAGNDIATVAPGVQLVANAGPTGDPIDTTGNALNVAIPNGVSPIASSSPSAGLLTYNMSTVNNTNVSAGTNIGLIKGSAGNIYGWHLYNPSGSVVFISFWDLPSGTLSWTSTTNTPVKFILAVPAYGWVDDPSLPIPIAFQFGIQIAVSLGYTFGSEFAPTAATLGNFWYK